jgi:hypothetical protein
MPWPLKNCGAPWLAREILAARDQRLLEAIPLSQPAEPPPRLGGDPPLAADPRARMKGCWRRRRASSPRAVARPFGLRAPIGGDIGGG